MEVSRLAIAKSRRRSRFWLILLLLLVAGLAALWLSGFGQRLRGDAAAGTAYGARVACSCRFVAGRSMEDCARDKLAGMGMIRLSADEDAKSVTASLPLIASETASLREGYGCVLQSWKPREG
jgi:hypothetical protein